MKHFRLLLFVTIFASAANSQTPGTMDWIFIKGDSLLPAVANYGKKGVPSYYNTPGGRISSVSWKDSSNNLFMFGGLGIDNMGRIGFF